MSDLIEHRLELNELVQSWNKAEAAMKYAERVNYSVNIPAIAELRYAGRRLVEALAAINNGNSSRQDLEIALHEAISNCNRASHDAIDGAISQMAIELDSSASKLGYRATLKAFPQFGSLVKKVMKLNERIAQTRADRSTRLTIYEDIQPDFVNAINDYVEFRHSQELMTMLVTRERLFSWISAGIGLIGIAASLITFLLEFSR